MRKMTYIFWIFLVIAIVAPLTGLGIEAGPESSGWERKSFLSHFMMRSDLVVLAEGKYYDARKANDYKFSVLEIKKVIASVWDEKATAEKFLKKDNKSFIVLIRTTKEGPMIGNEDKNPEIGKGEICLLWLRQSDISPEEAVKTGVGNSENCFRVVVGWSRSSSAARVHISDKYGEYNLCNWEKAILSDAFGVANANDLMAMVRPFARAMSVDSSCDGLLEKLSEHDDPLYRLNAQRLLKEPNPRRFKFCFQAPSMEAKP